MSLSRCVLLNYKLFVMEQENHLDMYNVNTVLIELVRAAVLERVPHIPSNITIDWDAMRTMASEHGLIGWIWDSINKLPQPLQPSRFQRIEWGLSDQEIETRYMKQRQVLLEMIEICKQNGMRLLLLKGFYLSELYPRPSARPSGDIDIYLFDDFEKGNRLFSNGIIPYKYKHTAFDFHGAHIENHQMLVTPNSKIKAKVGTYLQEAMSMVEKHLWGYYTLPLIPNLVYLITHALNHANYYPNKQFLNIKNMLDLAVFIQKNQSQIPPNEVRKVMKKLHFERSFEFVVYMSEMLLEMDFPQYHMGIMSQKQQKQLKELLYEDGLSLIVPDNLTKWVQIKMIWNRYCKIRRIYRYIPSKKENLHRITFHWIVSKVVRK